MRSGEVGIGVSARLPTAVREMSPRSSPDRGRTERAAAIEPNRECVLGLFQWHLRSLSNYVGNGNRRT